MRSDYVSISDFKYIYLQISLQFVTIRETVVGDRGVTKIMGD